MESYTSTPYPDCTLGSFISDGYIAPSDKEDFDTVIHGLFMHRHGFSYQEEYTQFEKWKAKYCLHEGD